MSLEDSGYAPLCFSRIQEKNSQLPHAYLTLLLGGYHGALQIRAIPAREVQQLEAQWLIQGHPGSDRHSKTFHPSRISPTFPTCLCRMELCESHSEGQWLPRCLVTRGAGSAEEAEVQVLG